MKGATSGTRWIGWTRTVIVAVVFLVVVGVAWRFVSYFREQRRPIVSFYNEWSAKGVPVDVCELKRGPFRIWRRTTATPMNGGSLHSFVTRNMRDRIRSGQAALLDLQDSAIPARVASVNQARDIDTGLYEVRFRPDDPSSMPKAPFYHVRVNTRTVRDALLVPVEAVQGMGDKSFVWVLDGDGVRRVPVETGFSDGVNVVLSSDMGSAEAIVTDGFEKLADGVRVRVRASSGCSSDGK